MHKKIYKKKLCLAIFARKSHELRVFVKENPDQLKRSHVRIQNSNRKQLSILFQLLVFADHLLQSIGIIPEPILLTATIQQGLTRTFDGESKEVEHVNTH